MRIAMVTHKVVHQDGQGRVNLEIALALLAQGHEVTVVADVCSDSVASHPKGRFVQISKLTLPTQMVRDLYFAINSGRWIREHRGEFDLVQANGFVMWEMADVVAVHYVHKAWFKNSSFPFHWSSLSPYAYYQRMLAILNVRFEVHAFRQAKIIIAVSESIAQEVEAVGVDRSRIRIVHNGVELEEFYPGTPNREEFGLTEGVPMALFAGDIRTPRKNLDTTLRALCRVPDLHLAVAGRREGSPYPELARKLGIADRVHFIGLTKKIALLMRSVDMFVMPSRYEPFGMVVMEAIVSGLPVVLSSKVGAVELIGTTSLVVRDPNDVEALSEAIKQVLQDPAAARGKAEAGRAIAMTLDWKNTTDGYINVYKEIISTRPSAILKED